MFRTRNTPEAGFTLVELAISITIIGLLLGGLLKGQELMENAKIGNVISQEKTIEAAIISFKTMYKELPGDFREASTRLNACTTAPCNVNGNGDGKIGTDHGVGSVINHGATDENRTAWLHLVKAGLITGIDANYTGSTNDSGVAFPKTAFDGSWQLYYALAPSTPFGDLADHFLMSHVADVSDHLGHSMGAHQAAIIDRKADDGMPNSGEVYGIGYVGFGDNSCITSSTDKTYPENDKSKSCDNFFRLKI